MKLKLIEKALPLADINREAAREKSIRHGHPSTLHLWWARRPLAACRAVLFAQLVDDPSAHPDRFPTEKAQQVERERLFKILRELVKWENSTNEEVLEAARAEIRKSCGGNPPPVYDPFCGGGSIPLEAQRLGLEAHGSDLNPVAVLITKALIEIPPRFAGRPPVHPSKGQGKVATRWKGAEGLADDVRYYGAWMREQAERRTGHLYPKVKLPKEKGGGEATVIAWLWARTVKCPNPACGAQMPLVRSFALSTKKGKETWVEPMIDAKHKTVTFAVRSGSGKAPDGTVNRRGARCLVCSSAVPFDHVRAEGRAGRMSAQMMAIVAEGASGRIYLVPDEHHATIAASAKPRDPPDTPLPEQALGFRVQNYGLTRHRDLFTPRQLVALTTFSDLVGEARERALADARRASLPNDDRPLRDGGTGPTAYADAISTYLALGVSRLADVANTGCTWSTSRDQTTHLFTRQAIPMTWDFAEACPFAGAGGDLGTTLSNMARALALLSPSALGSAHHSEATQPLSATSHAVVSTDPPYYDNIGYADLSDFFYVWLRRTLLPVFPDIFRTMLVPKSEELIADPSRFDGNREAAQRFFQAGMHAVFERLRSVQALDFPLTVYYAFRQSEDDEDSTSDESPAVDAGQASTGWETMLEGIVRANLMICGTWPVRSERGARTRSISSNALASSIVLVCRPRPSNAGSIARRDFVSSLKRELPSDLRDLQVGGIAPVDLAQSAIGPGMRVFSRYASVLESDGSPMSVRTVLQLINAELDTFLAAEEGELDRDSRFCLAWFDQNGMSEEVYGQAETLAKAKNISVEALAKEGVLSASKGKVRLLRPDELDAAWDPASDHRISAWECVLHLIRALNSGGESVAGLLLKLIAKGIATEEIKVLAYRLYSLCEKKGWADLALGYNALVSSWPAIEDQAKDATKATQPTLGLKP